MLFFGVQKTCSQLMIFIFLSIVKVIFSFSYCALFVPPKLLHPTKSNLYLANSLAAAISEPALYRLLTFHVPNRMSLFHFQKLRDTSSGNNLILNVKIGTFLYADGNEKINLKSV
jgi:hypothetical protein